LNEVHPAFKIHTALEVFFWSKLTNMAIGKPSKPGLPEKMATKMKLMLMMLGNVPNGQLE